ncbi:DegT/DnrJ/EryC1/StrS family aminotransferase [Dysgonomonadaceae bacterium zrk40]|nr:DegT/DnrJ/EryC1/StrS family aminotransferase [Dysgonomonadaceae bacterium zrk40]
MKRRNFLKNTSILSVGTALGLSGFPISMHSQTHGPAVLGGKRSFNGTWQKWPVIGTPEEEELVKVLHSGKWCRLGSPTALRFERDFSKMTGSGHALATSSGTTALTTMLGALDIGPGDEVILPPYTFIATYNVIVQNYALPIFVDTDIESFQIDASKIESAITSQTRALMPVHIGGSSFDVDAVMSVAKKYNLPVIEDACQAHFAEWKGKKVGTFGLGGAFSFQASKNLNSGEGGAIITNSEDFYNKCYSFHHQGQGSNAASLEPGSGTRGSNLRMTEFQAAILLAQMTRIPEQIKQRSENAAYLTKLLSEIPGVKPAKLYEGTTRSAYHLYMFRYDKEAFAGMDRSKFIRALNAEGISCSTGYTSLPKEAYVQNLSKNKHYLKIYGERSMKQWQEQINCPVNDKLCDEALWFTQTMLLGDRGNMELIADAIWKIHRAANTIKNI